MDAIPVIEPEYEISQPAVAGALNLSDVAHIHALFEKGKALMENQDYQQAIDAFDEGIQQLGYRYWSDNLSDDTDMKLLLGNAEQSKGLLERAAHLKHNVLGSRIHVYMELHGVKKENITYIGNAWMNANHDIIIQLFAQEDNLSGQTLQHYTPDHPQYHNVLKHLGGMRPDERKGVLPCPL